MKSGRECLFEAFVIFLQFSSLKLRQIIWGLSDILNSIPIRGSQESHQVFYQSGGHQIACYCIKQLYKHLPWYVDIHPHVF